MNYITHFIVSVNKLTEFVSTFSGIALCPLLLNDLTQVIIIMLLKLIGLQLAQFPYVFQILIKVIEMYHLDILLKCFLRKMLIY
jgi:hypothetical protein